MSRKRMKCFSSEALLEQSAPAAKLMPLMCPVIALNKRVDFR